MKNFYQLRDQKSVRKYFELKDCVDCEEKITLGKMGAEAYFFHILQLSYRQNFKLVGAYEYHKIW